MAWSHSIRPTEGTRAVITSTFTDVDVFATPFTFSAEIKVSNASIARFKEQAVAALAAETTQRGRVGQVLSKIEAEFAK